MQLGSQVSSAPDYHPFGLEMPGRKENSTAYRYGFNGKEKDQNGEWGSQTHYDYGFRIYNPAIAKFLSVDPLTKDYPWYTPYQFAGNIPIAAIDLDGLEPMFPATGGRDVTGTARDIFSASGGEKEFAKQPVVEQFGTAMKCSECLIQGQGASKDKFKRYVNNNNAFQVNGEITPGNFVNTLMGHFINGTGPENYVFPRNGAVSNEMKGSAIYKKAFFKFFNKNLDAIASGEELKEFNSGSGFGMFEQISTVVRNMGVLNVENFVGSAKISIEPISKDEVLVTVFNVTSLTSGDFSKHYPLNDYPKSIVRDPNSLTQETLSNISQTFSFTTSITGLMRVRARQIKARKAENAENGLTPKMTIPKY